MRKKLQVFISSTYIDLIEERQAAVEAVLSIGHIPAGMELFTAGDESQWMTIKKWIENSDVYLLILGGRYGSIEPDSNKSYTHLEYEYACANKIPVIGIVLTEKAINEKVKKLGDKAIEKVNIEQYDKFKTMVLSKMCSNSTDINGIKYSITTSLHSIEDKYNFTGWVSGKDVSDYEKLIQDKIMFENENRVLKAKLEKLERLSRRIGTLSEDSKVLSIHSLVDRFIKIYENHDILANQIPAFCDKEFDLKLIDFESKASILEILTDDLLNWTCSKFGIQREWIDGSTNSIYKRKDYYKRVSDFIELATNLKSEFDCEFDIFALKRGKLDNKSEREQYVVLVLRKPIGSLNSKIIYGYIPLSTLWNWGYWRTRYQIKSIFWVCKKLGIDTHGFDMDSKQIIEISSGSVFPKLLIDKIPCGYTWYTEDYIDLPDYSIQAKEIDEVNLVLDYIKDQRYDECLRNACNKYNLVQAKKYIVFGERE